jgi:fructose-specific phosphotransferase system IIC component
MAKPAADYHRGEMDIHEQASTYHAFLAFSKWGSLALAAVLVALIVAFATKAGIIGGVIAGVVFAVIV